MRRRTKPKVVWLPNTNANSVDTANRTVYQIGSASLNNGGGGAPENIEIPIVLDGDQNSPLDTNVSIADVESSGYRLRRIVGKVWIFLAQTATTAEDIYGCTAALIVRRVNAETGVSLASESPDAPNQVAPDDLGNIMDPWIWRRSWLLSNGPLGLGAALTDSALAAQIGRGPGTNFGRDAGSVLDGPHVDQKTARIVGPEERLFLDVCAQPLFINSGTPTSIVVVTNLRVLGSIRTNIGNRRNASR